MRYFPFNADHLAVQMQAKRGARVLGVASGTGMTAIAMAQTIGPEGRVQTIDLSDKMLDKGIWLDVEVLFVSGKRPA